MAVEPHWLRTAAGGGAICWSECKGIRIVKMPCWVFVNIPYLDWIAIEINLTRRGSRWLRT